MKEFDTHKSETGRASSFAEARVGLFRATLLFGSIAAALALIVVPAERRNASAHVEGLDQMITSSIRTPGGDPLRYTMRQVPVDRFGPCLLFPDGSQKGAC